MLKYFELLNDEQLDFIANEFGILKENIFSINSIAADSLYDEIGLIEADEVILANGGPLSRRGKLATSIVTVLGNALAKDMGWIDKK